MSDECSVEGMPQRVGVMGGTFDPVHLGHLRVAEEAVEAMGLDILLFVPAAVPPHKLGKKILGFEHRWRMLEASTLDHPRFAVSDVELQVPGKSYTVNTLQKLTEAYGSEVELFFILGMDAFLELDTWWHFKELFKLARLVVLRRPGSSEAEMARFLAERVSSQYLVNAAEASFTHPQLLSGTLFEQHLAGYFINPHPANRERRKVHPLSGTPGGYGIYLHEPALPIGRRLSRSDPVRGRCKVGVHTE